MSNIMLENLATDVLRRRKYMYVTRYFMQVLVSKSADWLLTPYIYKQGFIHEENQYYIICERQKNSMSCNSSGSLEGASCKKTNSFGRDLLQTQSEPNINGQNLTLLHEKDRSNNETSAVAVEEIKSTGDVPQENLKNGIHKNLEHNEMAQITNEKFQNEESARDNLENEEMVVVSEDGGERDNLENEKITKAGNDTKTGENLNNKEIESNDNKRRSEEEKEEEETNEDPVMSEMAEVKRKVKASNNAADEEIAEGEREEVESVSRETERGDFEEREYVNDERHAEGNDNLAIESTIDLVTEAGNNTETVENLNNKEIESNDNKRRSEEEKEEEETNEGTVMAEMAEVENKEKASNNVADEEIAEGGREEVEEREEEGVSRETERGDFEEGEYVNDGGHAEGNDNLANESTTDLDSEEEVEDNSVQEDSTEEESSEDLDYNLANDAVADLETDDESSEESEDNLGDDVIEDPEDEEDDNDPDDNLGNEVGAHLEDEGGGDEDFENESESEDELQNDNDVNEVRDNTLFRGFRQLGGMRAPLRNSPDIRAIDLLLMTLAEAVRFRKTYVHIEHSLQWIKDLYVRINVPTTKKTLWKTIGKDESNLIYTLYCEKCRDLIGNGKKVTIACTCGSCGPGMQQTFVATFVQVPLTPQLKDLLKCPKVYSALKYKENRVKTNENAAEDIFDGEAYKNLTEEGNFLSNPNNFSLTLWTDGASVADSSKASMWPILMQINEFSPHARKKHTLLAGLWIAKEKPCVFAIFKSIVEELKELYNIGITWFSPDGIEILSKFIVLIFTADSVARPMVLRMKQYNGINGCTICLATGEIVENRRVFRAEPSEMRTDESIRHNAIEAVLTRSEKNGILGWSPLASIPLFNLAIGPVVDLCHCAYIGMTFKSLDLFLNDSGNEWYIGTPANKAIINSRLAKIKTPTKLSRRTRDISSYNQWKASELRNWLLYYALPCLEGILPERYFQHFTMLAEAIFICNNGSITEMEMNLAERLLDRFVSEYEELYGMVNMSFNLHLLTHLPISVRKWGPAWVYSTFVYESMNKKFVDSITSPVHRVEQIVTRFFMEKFVRYATEEYNINHVTRERIQKLLKISVENVPPEMPEGHYFIGRKRAALERLNDAEIILIQNTRLRIDQNIEVSLFEKATIHGVDFQVENNRDTKFCDHVAFCRGYKFVIIEKLLSYRYEEQTFAGFIGRELKHEGQAYNTTHMKYVTPTATRCFVSYKDVLGPAIIMPSTTYNVAVSISNIWETD